MRSNVRGVACEKDIREASQSFVARQMICRCEATKKHCNHRLRAMTLGENGPFSLDVVTEVSKLGKSSHDGLPSLRCVRGRRVVSGWSNHEVRQGRGATKATTNGSVGGSKV